jgi:hypothetical protein
MCLSVSERGETVYLLFPATEIPQVDQVDGVKPKSCLPRGNGSWSSWSPLSPLLSWSSWCLPRWRLRWPHHSACRGIHFPTTSRRGIATTLRSNPLRTANPFLTVSGARIASAKHSKNFPANAEVRMKIQGCRRRHLGWATRPLAPAHSCSLLLATCLCDNRFVARAKGAPCISSRAVSIDRARRGRRARR